MKTSYNFTLPKVGMKEVHFIEAFDGEEDGGSKSAAERKW
jgi:hypothetical protein